MTNIYVGNISFQTTKDDLRIAFESFGAIERVSVVTDRDTAQGPIWFVLIALAGWLNQHQQNVIDYLREENRALRNQLGQSLASDLLGVDR